MATISKKFVDINPKFEKNPLSGDLPLLKNVDAIKQSVKHIVLTQRGEKPFRPFFGSSAGTALFENFGSVTSDVLARAIEDALRAYEPRVEVIGIIVDQNIETNSFDLTVNYEIIGIPLDPQSLNLILERV
jgi:phage baseplate assembly protein W